jgi:hypothetical protein
MAGVAEAFTSVIHAMKYVIDFKLVCLLHSQNANLTDGDLNTTIDEPAH